MKPQVVAALALLAGRLVFAATPLTSEEIHRAVDEASKQYLGDCPLGCEIVVDYEFYHGSLSADIRESYLKVFDSFSFTEQFFRLGWHIYFPKRDFGFDFIITKQVEGAIIIRPVPVK